MANPWRPEDDPDRARRLEARWLTEDDPRSMRELLGGRAGGPRLGRLFQAACSRRVWHLLTREEREEVQRWEGTAEGLLQAGPVEPGSYTSSVTDAAYLVWSTTKERSSEAWDAERRAQCDLLRCIFGNPFRPPTIAPAWLTPAVHDLARLIYDDRRFDLMPILGAALSDAGCRDAVVLGHCVATTPHVRGCHVVDLLLNKS